MHKFGCYKEKFITYPVHDLVKQNNWKGTFDEMHPYATYDNKLSNKSIKLIKCIDSCSEESMERLIKNLLEDKEEDIHFMKNKIKELEDTNKDLLLKMDEIKEKHNELVNRLMDRIVELS
jgi:hypothetical protein